MKKVIRDSSTTTVKSSQATGGSHWFFRQGCACCSNNLSSQQSLEILDCCSSEANLRVVHQSCLSKALQPITRIQKVTNADGSEFTKSVSEQAKCPCCHSVPRHSKLSSAHLTFIDNMDVQLAEQVSRQLTLRQVFQLIDAGFTQAHFLASYGSQLSVPKIIGLLKDIDLFSCAHHAQSVFYLLAKHHHHDVFQYALSQSKAGQLLSAITDKKLLKAVHQNKANEAVMMKMIINRLFQEKMVVDPEDHNAKKIWTAFTHNATQSQALIAALSASNLLEHKYALAHVYRDGVNAREKGGIKADTKEAVRNYLIVIDGLLSKKQAYTRDDLRILEEACRYVISNIKEKVPFNAQHLIHAVHLLAVNRIAKSDELLLFIYKDSLQHGASPNDFLQTYRQLAEANLPINLCKSSENWTLLHFVTRYWPLEKVSFQQFVAVIQSLVDNKVDINAVDAQDNSPLHHICRYSIESKVFTAKERVTLVNWFVNQLAAIANNTNKDNKTPLQIVCELWLRPDITAKLVFEVVKCLARKTNIKQHSGIFRLVLQNWPAYKDPKVSGDEWVDLVSFFFEQGADPNQLAKDQSPLAHVVALNWLQQGVEINTILTVLALFVEKKADLNAHYSAKPNAAEHYTKYHNAEDPATHTVLASICQHWVEKKVGITFVIGAIRLMAPKMNKDELALVLEIILTTWPKQGVRSEIILEAMQTLIKCGINVQHVGRKANTLLHCVTEHWVQNRLDVDSACLALTMLIDARVDINAQGSEKNTVLNNVCSLWASAHVDLDRLLVIIATLKQRGARTSIANAQGNLPLHIAFLSWPQVGVNFKQIVGALDALLPDHQQQVLAVPASSGPLLPQAQEDILPIDQKNHQGKTLLHMVCSDWARVKPVNFQLIESVVNLLIERQAKAYVSTQEGFTPLHYICQLGELTNAQAMQICQKLLTIAPAMINAKTRTNETALHLFCQHWMGNARKDSHGFPKMLEHLQFFLRNRADVNMFNDTPATPMHILASLWIQQGATPQQIISAIQMLVDSGAELNRNGATSLAMIVGAEWINHGVHAHLILNSLQTIQQMGTELRVHDQHLNNLLHHVVLSWAKKYAPIDVIQAAIQYLIQQSVDVNLQNINKKTPMHIICQNWVGLMAHWKISVADIQRTMELFYSVSPNLNLMDQSKQTPLLAVGRYWLQQGAHYSELLATLKRMTKFGADPYLLDGDDKNLCSYYAEDWAYRVADQQLAVFLELFAIAPDLNVNVVSKDLTRVAVQSLPVVDVIHRAPGFVLDDLGSGSIPLHVICRDWMAKGIPFNTVKALVEQFIGKQVNLNLKDQQGDTPTLIMVKTWLAHRGVSFDDLYRVLVYCLSNNASVNAIDRASKTLLHYIFELWGNKIEPRDLWAFVALMGTHGANFNIPDFQGCPPLFNLFTHWSLVNNNELFMPMLQQFEQLGADLSVQNTDALTVVHLAASYSTAEIFNYLIAKFPSSSRILGWCILLTEKASLFNCIARNNDKDTLFRDIFLYLLGANVPLDITTPEGKSFWANLLRHNIVMDFFNTFIAAGNAQQAMCMARFYLDSQVCKSQADPEQARRSYEIALIKIFAGPVYQLTQEHLAMMDEIHVFGQHKFLGINFKRNDFIAPAERTALGMLVGDKKTPQNVGKALVELESLSKKGIIQKPSLFACIVLARHLETGYLLERADLGRAFQFYRTAMEMPLQKGELSAFSASCQSAAFNGIERLSTQLDEATGYLIEYFAREQRLDLAEHWYGTLVNPSATLTHRMGQLCSDLGEFQLAIDRYHFVPALIRRADVAVIEMRFADAGTDYCSALLGSRNDISLQRQVGEGLIKLSAHLVPQKLCVSLIVGTMLEVIRLGDFDPTTFKHILSAFDHIGRVFSEVACVAPKSATLQNYMPTFIMPLVRKVERKVESTYRVYATDTAEAYLDIMRGDDAEFAAFKERHRAGQTTKAVTTLILAICRHEISLPNYLVDEKFQARLAQLQEITPELQGKGAGPN